MGKQGTEVEYPGVAQLVACLTGGQEAVGSSPATRTNNYGLKHKFQPVFAYFQNILTRFTKVKSLGAHNFAHNFHRNSKLSLAVVSRLKKFLIQEGGIL